MSDGPTSAGPFRALASAYATAIDRRDGDALARLFTEDGVLDSPGSLFRGPAEIRTVIDLVTQAFVKTMHFVHNVSVAVDGETATGETYGIASHIIAGDDGTWSKLDWAIRYQDRYRREAGVWRYRSRTLIVEWTTTGPAEPFVRPPLDMGRANAT